MGAGARTCSGLGFRVDSIDITSGINSDNYISIVLILCMSNEAVLEAAVPELRHSSEAA